MKELFNQGGWTITEETATLPDGRIKTGLRVRRSDGAHIIAFKTPETILMLREYRPFYGEYIWMLPSGKVDKELDIKEGARRELQEETGYDARELEFFCTGNQSDSLVITNHIFVARDLFKSALPQDPDELIEVHELSLEDAITNVLGSPKVHLTSAYALLRYKHERT